MAKQLNVDLNFKANTSQAQAAIQGLVNDLNKINNGTGLSKDIAITSQIREAQMAAGELSHALQNAFNVDTGKLDLNKLSTNLKSSGMSLTDYGNKLAALGPTGDQAFLKIAQSIVATEAPLRRSSGLLKQFSTTLANTARWQISSSILHGFLGSVQKAYGYAQDLNESLNNIRIVTNKSSEDMANFAKNANKAAKELSTTTTAYTNAALIYYQQGDDDQTVLEKTDVTAKMANVTGTSAQAVSDQLTAIWNNFNASGEESYEKYADVLTALGAATASSTDEIAGGLEKFASIADMIGLSYEYAASALATITATTRQSEDVVGTALKTIFARIQGLNLGETLDDGTTLNKYSEALSKVGISIKDSSGQMKQMDTILDEMGDKWTTLSKDQQIALAQTVAGVRQYNQLVSLMDNWDFMEKNLEIANNSQGTLDEQAAIYEESWAASSARVRASLESIWETLVDDDFFIGLNDGISHMVDTIKILIDSMGGVKGVVAGLGLALTTVFKNNITDGINNALHNFRNFTGVSKKELESLQTEAYEYAQAMTAGLSDSPGVQAQRDHLSRTYSMQKELQTMTKGMSDEQMKVAKAAYDTAQAYSEAAMQAGQMADEAERANVAQRDASSKKYGSQMKIKMQDTTDFSQGLAGSDLIKQAQSMVTSAREIGGLGTEINAVTNAVREYGAEISKPAPDMEKLSELAQKVRTSIEGLNEGAQKSGNAFTMYQSALSGSAQQVISAKASIDELKISLGEADSSDQLIQSIDGIITKAKEAKLPIGQLVAAYNKYKQALDTLGPEHADTQAALQNLGRTLKTTSISSEQVAKSIKKVALKDIGDQSKKTADRLRNMGDALNADAEKAGIAAQKQLEFNNATVDADKKLAKLKGELMNSGTAYQSLGSAMTGALRGISSFAMGLQSLSSIKNTLENPDMTSWEKTLSIMTSLGMAIPMVTTGLSTLGNMYQFVTSATTKGLTGQLAYMLGLDMEILKTQEVVFSKEGEVLARGKAGSAAVLEAAKIQEATVVTELNTAATWKNIAAKLIQYWYIGLIILAIGALIAIIYKSVEAYNADAEAAKEATAQAQSLTERYNELTEASNKFRESCKGYEDAVKSFKDLEKGAEGYEEALKKANDEAKKLIETYKLYDNYKVVDGLITIDEDALKDKQREMDAEARKAEGQKYQADIYANNANLRSQATNTSRKTASFGTGTYTYAEGGAYENYRRISGDEAQAIGKVINDLKEVNEGVTPSAEQVKQALEDLGSESGLASDAMNNLDTIITDDTIGKFGDLADSMTEAQKANEYYARQIMGIAVEEKYGDELREKATDADGNFDQQKYNQLLEVYTQRAVEQDSQSEKDLADKYSEIDVSGVSSTGDLNKILSGATEETLKAIFGDTDFSSIDNDEELAKAYAQMMGYGDADSLSYKGGWGKGSITDATGKKVLDNMNDETMRREIAKQIQMQQITEQYTKDVGQDNEAFDGALDSLMSGAEAAGAKYGGDFQNALLNALSTEDKKIDLSSLFGELDPGEVKEINNMTDEQILALFGMTEEQIKALGYDSGKQFAEEVKAGLNNYSEEAYIDAADKAGNERAQELDLDVDELEAYRDLLAQIHPELAENRKALNDVAIANKRMEKGVKTLAGDWEDFNDIMTDSEASIEDVSSVLPDINEGLQDILNISDEEFELLPPDFAKKNWGLIQDVMNGVDGAVDELRDKAGEEILLNVDGVLNDEQLQADMLALHNEIAAYDAVSEFEVGVAINDADFLEKCNQIIQRAGMTAEQANTYFKSMGYDVELEEVQAKDTPMQTYKWYPLDEEATAKAGGIPQFSETPKTVSTSSTTEGTAYAVKTITPTGSYGGGTGVNTTAPKSATSGATGGNKGGGSKPKKTKDSRKDKDELVDRYKEINDKLEETQRLMKKNNTLAEGMYGAKRFAKLRENIKLMEQENKQLKEKYQKTLDYLELDEAALNKVASEVGVSFNIDKETGNITNYTQQMTALWEERERLLDSFGATMDEKEQERLEDFDKRVEALEKAYEKYEKTLDEKKDAEEEHLEKILEIQTAYYDLLNEELEVKISLNDDALSVLEYYLDKMSDDFYQMAEAAAFMLNGVNDDGKGQYQISKSNLKHQEDYINKLEKDHSTINPETGETYINDAQYVEGLRNSRDAIIEELNALKELDDKMMNYYGDTIAMAQEELAKYTDVMEHHTSVLEHYQTILELTGKQNDHEALGVVLEGQAKTAENRVKVAEAEMNMYKEQADLRWQDYQNALKRGDKAAAELHLKEYEAALAAANEAEENYLSSAEEWAESLRAVLENTMKGLAQDLENILTGGTSFAQMTTAMERAASLQEEYLTTTNQIYETNKLMRTAQQEIDKTTNSVAKRRLKQFINETEQMQNQSKLSKYELDIQQAKYNLLLAEIALEEAQNVKSTVRLQRDSDGNFGYVYTADQSAVDQAEQELLDKQNALYNIGLEGANDYAQKYQQTLNEMYDAITELQQQKLDGMFETEEEYQNAVMATKKYYYQKLSDYSHLYSIALTTDSAVVEDAWSTDFNSMIYNTDKWQKSVNEYIEEVQRELTNYETKMQQVAEKTVGKNLAEIKKKTKEVTDENDKLVQKITNPSNGVIKALTDEMNSVASLTGKYANLRSEIQNLISTYERMLGRINQNIDTTVNNPSSPSSNPGNNNNGGDNSGKKQQAKAIAKEASEIVTKVHNGTIKQTSSGWKPSAREMGYSENAISVAAQAFNDSKSGGGYDYCYEKALKLVGLDTGGYTGDWEGSYGKLALLHKKELVLNEHDTENFLTGIDLLNKIISIIDLQSISSQLGGILSSPSLGNINNDETLEQQVHIEASFPNVQDRNEIEEAFNNLINKASQYAHRK